MKFVGIRNTLDKMGNDFAAWLNKQLDQRGWSRSEAARRGGFSSSMFDKVVSGYAKPGVDFCNGISRAFHVPPEDVFRLAGLLPSKPATLNERRLTYRIGNYTMTERMVELFEQLDGDEQELVVLLLERLAQARGDYQVVGREATDESE